MHLFRRLLGIGLVLVSFAAIPATSQAGVLSFCTFGYMAQAACNPSGYDRSYRGIVALGGGPQDKFWKCAGATRAGSSTPYGSYFCANSYGCHAYSGSNVLRPKIKNGGTPQVLTGRGAFGVDYFNGCSNGTAQPMSLTKPEVLLSSARKALPIFKGRGTGVVPPKTLEKDFNVDVIPEGSVSFRTPRGKTGWVVLDGKTDQVCLLVQDTVGYGFTCKPRFEAYAAGIAGSLASDDAGSVQIEVKPIEASVSVEAVTAAEALAPPVL